MQDYLKIVIAGDVDSGKSTLIGRFLYDTNSLPQGAIEETKKVSRALGRDFEFAYLLDSFEEERRNQLTIDTTQVFCKNKKGKGFIFIDIPGHEELLRNMLCGSSYADIAVLVVDVGKSIEEQTKRHAFILKFIGIEQIILALNKMDAVSFEERIFQMAKENVLQSLKKIAIEPEYCVPISAKEGKNLCKKSKDMLWHRGPSLLEALNMYSKKKLKGFFRLPVQDVYSLNGEKVAVGELVSGEIKEGEEVKVLPLKEIRKVKKIKVFGVDKSSAKAPESIGLVLDKMEDIRRGLIICKESLPQISTEISTKFLCTSPLINTEETLRFRCTTQEVLAKIKEIKTVWDTTTLEPRHKKDSLKEADIVEATLITGQPVVTEKFRSFNNLGRFVLKSNTEICATGIIC